MKKPLPKAKIQMSIDFDTYYEGSIQDQVVHGLVQRMHERLADKVEQQVEKTLLELADKEFERIAESELLNFFTKAHRKTNSWGEPSGETTTVREMLVSKFAAFLDEKVDENGKNSSYSASVPRTQWLLTKLAHEPLQQAIKETTGKLTEKYKRLIQDNVSAYLAQQLAPTINKPAALPPIKTTP